MTDAPCFTAKLALIESALDGLDVGNDAEYDSDINGTMTVTSNVRSGDLVQIELEGETKGMLIMPQQLEIRDGIMRRPLREGEALEDVPVGVRLPLDQGLFDGPLQWIFTFTSVKVRGVEANMRPIRINASTVDEVRNLAEEAPVAGVDAVGIMRGPRGFPIDNVTLNGDGEVVFWVQGVPVGSPLALTVVDMSDIDGGTAASPGIGILDGGGA